MLFNVQLWYIRENFYELHNCKRQENVHTRNKTFDIIWLEENNVYDRNLPQVSPMSYILLDFIKYLHS